MASCITSQWVNTAPQVKLTVTQTASTDTTATLTYTLQYIASSAANTNVNRSYTVTIAGEQVASGSYNIDGKTGTHTICSGTKVITKGTAAKSIAFSASFAFNLTWSGSYKGTLSASSSISVAAKTSYKITYNANGGSGAPSAQTKWHGTALTLSSTKPTRTGYTFQGWGTSASGSVVYAAGASYTANASDTLYAIWKANTYTVKYNANGGSGAPANQTKTYGTTLKLSSTKPTRTNYTFKGWGTSASATTVSYAAGANYTNNSAITLYAVWELAYTKPVIYNLTATRCDSAGTSSDTGSYGKISFNWETTNAVSGITIAWNSKSGGSGTATVSASGTSGTVNQVIGSGALSTDVSYSITVTVTDSGGSSEAVTSLSGTAFVMDILAEGKGIAFGKPAELEGVADFGYDAMFNGSVYGNVRGLNKLPSIPENSDFNDYITIGCWAVYMNSTAATISNIPVTRAGRLEVSSSTGEGIRLEEYSYLRQKYIPYNMSNATWERDVTRGSDNVWNFGEWTRTTLNPAASAKVYHEQKILWSGVYYMTDTQTAELSEPVSDQPNGIVLVFSRYTNGAAQNTNFKLFFVPKCFVSAWNGYGCAFNMFDTVFDVACSKYVYIHDTKIVGNANNDSTGTGDSGIKFANNQYVLRFVYGV